MATENAQDTGRGEVQEAFTASAAKIDPEAGVLYGALIFGPTDRVGNYYRSSSGRLYSAEFFQSLAAEANGALAWAGHPDRTANGEWRMRDMKEAIGKWANVSLVAEGGVPKVRGDFKLRKGKKDDYVDVIAEGADRCAFSIFGSTITKFDRSIGEDIHVAVDPKARRKMSIDLVEAGGANKTIFESASADSKAKETSKEKDMTQEEITKMLDESTAKAKAEVLESLKPQLEDAKKIVAENTVLKRKQVVADALRDNKLDEKHVSESFRDMLLTCPEDKIAGLIQDRKSVLAASVDPIKDAGGEKKGDNMTAEHAVEVLNARGLQTVVAEMAGKGFAAEADKDRAFARMWVDKIGRRLCNKSDKTPETKQMRKLVAEQYANAGIRNVFAQMYGFVPTSEADLSVLRPYTDDRAITVAEAAIDSTSFSALNNTVLTSVIIEAQNDATGLVADQLTTEYRTNKETENVPGFSEPSDLENVSEGAEKPDATITNKYVTLQKIVKRAKKVQVTREAVLYDQTGLLLDRCNRIGINAMLDREAKLIKGIVDDPSFYSYYPSGTRVALWNSTNTEEANALSDYTDIENAVRRLSRQLDSLSRRLRDNVSTPLEVLLPFELWVSAQHIFTAELFESGPNAANNMRFRNGFQSARLFVSQTLDALNTSTWYIAGAGGFKKQYLRKVTFPMEVVPVPAAEVSSVIKDIVAGVAVMYAEQVFARENVRVVRNYATALS